MTTEKYDDYNDSHISRKWAIYIQKVCKTNLFVKDIFNTLDSKDLKNVLDFGCGPANDSNLFIEKGFIVTAVTKAAFVQ